MLQLVDPNKPIVWVHPDDRKKLPNDQTLFHIKPLTEAQSRRLKIKHPTKMIAGAVVLDDDAMMFELFIECVVKIEHAKSPEGESISFENDNGARQFLESIPPEFMKPIYAAIQNTGDLSDGELGNLNGSRDSATS